ncbi:MAG: TldD/PmbA family protein [Thermoplasmata archaeon]
MRMLDIGEKVVNTALKSGADSAEAFLLWEKSTGVEIEKDEISSSSSGAIFGMGIRIIKSGKLGFSYCTDASKIKEAIDGALSVSVLSKKTKFEFPEAAKQRKIEKTCNKKIIDLEPEEAVEKVREIIESAKEIHKDIIVTSGGVGFGHGGFAVVNSNGLRVQNNDTGIAGGASVVLKNGGVSTGFDSSVSRILNIDFKEIGRTAAKIALKGCRPKKFASGKTTVLFTPNAIGSLFEYVVIPAFYADAAKKGESIFSDKLNRIVMPEAFSIIDDGTIPNGVNSASCDDEGVPSRRLEIIKNGVLKSYLYDRSAATEYGEKSTSSGIRSERLLSGRTFKSIPKTAGRNVTIIGKPYANVVARGKPYADAAIRGKPYALENIISEVKNGILVYDILGGHTANPVSGDFSVNSTILFKIENGEIKHGLKPVMLSGNMKECLKNITMLGDDYRMLAGQLSPVGMILPTICVEDVRVTA